jgi:hypothetical protein
MKPLQTPNQEYQSESSHYGHAYAVALILMSSLMVASIWAVHGGLG